MKNKISFESAMKQLEDITQKLENGDLTLEESIELFQKGMELSNVCSKQLDQAERKITMLIQNKMGEFEEVPFENEGE